MWSTHGLAKRSLRNSPWHRMRDTTSIDRYFYALTYRTELKRQRQSEGNQTCSLSKTSHGGIPAQMHGGFTVRELWNRIDRMRRKECQRKETRKVCHYILLAWATSAAETMTRHQLGRGQGSAEGGKGYQTEVDGCRLGREMKCHTYRMLALASVYTVCCLRGIITLGGKVEMNKNSHSSYCPFPIHPTKPVCVLWWWV